MILNNVVFHKDDALVFFVLCDRTSVGQYNVFFFYWEVKYIGQAWLLLLFPSVL